MSDKVKLRVKVDDIFQKISNLTTSWSQNPSNTNYPSEKLVKDSLDEKISIDDNSNYISYPNGTLKLGLQNPTVVIIWDDNNDENSERPNKVIVSLKDASANTYYSPQITLNESNNWTGTVNSIAQDISYAWRVMTPIPSYTQTKTKMGDVTTITIEYVGNEFPTGFE